MISWPTFTEFMKVSENGDDWGYQGNNLLVCSFRLDWIANIRNKSIEA